MKKLFLSLFLLVPLSLHAMDNPQRLLVYGTSALAVGYAGHQSAKWLNAMAHAQLKCALEKNQNELNDCYGELTRADELAYKWRERKTFFIGAMRTSSYLLAGALAQYALCGKALARNMQTHASLLAIEVGGGLFAVGRSKKNGTLALLSGAGLAGLGVYGLYRNS